MYVRVHEVVVHSQTHVLQTEKKEIECRRGLEPISHLSRPQSEMDITTQCQYNNIPTKAMDSQADWCIISFTTTPVEGIEYPNTLHTCTCTKKHTQDTHAQDTHTQKHPPTTSFSSGHKWDGSSGARDFSRCSTLANTTHHNSSQHFSRNIGTSFSST